MSGGTIITLLWFASTAILLIAAIILRVILERRRAKLDQQPRFDAGGIVEVRMCNDILAARLEREGWYIDRDSLRDTHHGHYAPHIATRRGGRG